MRAALVLSLALQACLAQAQPKNPQVGATVAPLDEAGFARDARRSIIRDTLSRQYRPEEIEQYRNAIDAYEKSQAGGYAESAKVIKRRVKVSLAADAVVHEIRLNAENVGSLVFTDAAGAPWKIADVISPNFLTATAFNNIVTFRPKGQAEGRPAVRFARGSLTILLVGLNSTIPFAVSFGFSKDIDGQIEAQVDGRNPSAVIDAVQGGAIETDEMFGLFIDGEPPKEAVKVRTSVKGVDAWSYMGRLYVRCALSLHSPAYRMFGSSASGMSVYRFDKPPSVINAIVDGSVLAVYIGD